MGVSTVPAGWMRRIVDPRFAMHGHLDILVNNASITQIRKGRRGERGELE